MDLYWGAVEMDPKFMSGRLVLGQAYEQTGLADQAIAELQTAVDLSGAVPWIWPRCRMRTQSPGGAITPRSCIAD